MSAININGNIEQSGSIKVFVFPKSNTIFAYRWIFKDFFLKKVVTIIAFVEKDLLPHGIVEHVWKSTHKAMLYVIYVIEMEVRMIHLTS